MPEKAPSAVEQSPRRFNRGELLDTLTERAQQLQRELVFNSPHLVEYAGILSITAELAAGDDLGPAERRHLRKMAALEARRHPLITKTPGDYKFWETVEVLTGAEWKKAQTFAEDLSDVPKSWQIPKDSLLMLNQNLTEPKK